MKEPLAKVIVLSGPSGSGKTSLCKNVAKDLNLYYAVSFTTRSPRIGEVHGTDYFFISKQEFEGSMQRGELLEWAIVYDQYYGTSKKIIEEKLQSGQSVILDLDTQGALNIKKLFPNALTIFIDTESLAELEVRLKARGLNDLQEIKRRLQSASHELSCKNNYDFIVMNKDFIKSLAEISKIITGHTPS